MLSAASSAQAACVGPRGEGVAGGADEGEGLACDGFARHIGEIGLLLQQEGHVQAPGPQPLDALRGAAGIQLDVHLRVARAQGGDHSRQPGGAQRLGSTDDDSSPYGPGRRRRPPAAVPPRPVRPRLAPAAVDRYR